MPRKPAAKPSAAANLDAGGIAGHLATWAYPASEVREPPSWEYLSREREQRIRDVRDYAERKLKLWRVDKANGAVVRVVEPDEWGAVARRLAAALDADEALWRAARRIADRETHRTIRGVEVPLSYDEARARAIARHPRLWRALVTAEIARADSFACRQWLAIEAREVASYALAARDAWHVAMTDAWLRPRALALFGDASARRNLMTAPIAVRNQVESTKARTANTVKRYAAAQADIIERMRGGMSYDDAFAVNAASLGIQTTTLARKLPLSRRLIEKIAKEKAR